MTRSHRFARPQGVIIFWGLLVPLAFLMPAIAPAQSTNNPNTQTTTPTQQSPVTIHRALADQVTENPPPTLSAKQRQSILQANFAKSKADSAELAAMAKNLLEELNKPGVDILSLEVANRADKIEKLAKKIREETKGF